MAINTKKRIAELEKELTSIRETIQTKGGNPQLRAKRESLQKELNQLKTSQQTDEIAGQNKLAEYGFAYGLIQSDPSLQELFQRFLESGSSWLQPKVEAELRNTDWFKNNDLAKRNYEILRTGDSKTFEKVSTSWKEWVTKQASSLGANLSDEDIAKFADQLMQGGISQDKALDIFASTYIDYGNADLIGRAGALQDELVSLNKQYGNILGDSQINNYVRQMLTNKMMNTDVTDMIRRTAASTYSNFSDRIMAGETVDDIASPYKKLMQDYLELSDVNLQDNLMLDALSGKTEKGTAKYNSLSEFRKAIKSDPRWQYTDNARGEYFGIAQKVLNDFGFLG
jgi:hypothetical protein